MAMVAADDATVTTNDTAMTDPTVLHTEHLNKIEVNGVEVVMKTTQPGDATHFPSAGNTVRVHYVGKLQQDGVVFDSSREREHPISFVVGSTGGKQQVIDGLDAAVLSMSRGQIATVTIPPEVGIDTPDEPHTRVVSQPALSPRHPHQWRSCRATRLTTHLTTHPPPTPPLRGVLP